eukprot:Platyproteum_vivax@DN361_c0_g1_i1.p1
MERVLIKAFGMKAEEAYSKYQERKMRRMEPVRVYYADVRELGKICGVEDVWNHFVYGLPKSIRVLLKTMPQMGAMDVEEKLDIVEDLMDGLNWEPAYIGAIAEKQNC